MCAHSNLKRLRRFFRLSCRRIIKWRKMFNFRALEKHS